MLLATNPSLTWCRGSDAVIAHVVCSWCPRNFHHMTTCTPKLYGFAHTCITHLASGAVAGRLRHRPWLCQVASDSCCRWRCLPLHHIASYVTIVSGLPLPGHTFNPFHWRFDPLRPAWARLRPPWWLCRTSVPAPFKPSWPPGGLRFVHRASQGQGGGQTTHSPCSSLRWSTSR